MEPNAIVLIVISGLFIWGALIALGGLFKLAIQALNFVGSLIIAGLAAAGSVILSSVIFDISTAQAAVQFVGTQTVLAGIGMGMFAGNNEDNV